MKRALLLAIGLLLLSARAGAQATSAAAEYLCVSDSITVSRGPDNLVEGLQNVLLNWTASTSSPDWNNVYRGTINGGPYSQIGTCARGTSYTDSTVKTGQDLFYVVTAVRAGVESVDSNQVEAQIPVFDAIAAVPNWQPLTTETLSTSDGLAIQQIFTRSPSESLAGGSSVDLAVTDPTSSNLSTQLNTSDALGNSQTLGRGAGESLSSSDLVSAGKNSAPSGTLSAPYRLSVTATAQPPRVNLSWAQSVSPNLQGSNVYRHAQQGGPYYLLAPLAPQTTFFTDLTVTGGTRYCYVVTAIAGGAESPYSNEACSTPPSGVSPPFRISVTILLGHPFLSWTQSATRGLTANNLYRGTVHWGPYTLVSSFSPSTSITDATTTPGQTYYYVVTAVSNGQESGYSNEAVTRVP